MVHRRTVSLHYARQILLAACRPVKSETAKLEDAFGRIIAENIYAGSNEPAYNIALNDGFAVISSDIESSSQSEPTRLGIAYDTVKQVPPALVSGTTAPVIAGCQLPQNADAVIPKDSVFRAANDPMISILMSVDRYEGVLKAGSIIKKGDILAYSGTAIGSREMRFASLNNSKSVRINKSPCISMFFSGPFNNINTEVLRYWALAQAFDTGAAIDQIHVINPGRLPVEESLRNLSSETDIVMIVIAGGLPSDPVIDALKASTEVQFERVQLHPSGPVAFGMRNDIPVIVCGQANAEEIWEALFRPAIRTMLGCSTIDRELIPVRLSSSIKLPPGCSSILRASIRIEENEQWAFPLKNTIPWLISPDVTDGFILVPEDISTLSRGAWVDFIKVTR